MSPIDVRPKAESEDGRVVVVLSIEGEYGDEWRVFRNFGTAEEGDWRTVEWRPFQRGDTASDVLASYLAKRVSTIYDPAPSPPRSESDGEDA